MWESRHSDGVRPGGTDGEEKGTQDRAPGSLSRLKVEQRNGSCKEPETAGSGAVKPGERRGSLRVASGIHCYQ